MRAAMFGLSAIGLVAACLAMAAGQALKPVEQPVRQPGAEIRPKIDEVLSRRMDLLATESPLKEVLARLSEQTGIPFHMNVKSLNDAGINPDTPITVQLRGLRLSTLLGLLLDELDLTYIDQDELILITTPDDAESRLVVRVYDCRDLLAASPAAEPGGAGAPAAPALRTDAPPQTHSLQQSHPPPAIGCGSVQAGWKVEGPAGQLMHVLTNGVDVHTWNQVGGPGTISEYKGLIVVTQTARTQNKVERLLDMLREAAGLENAKPGQSKVVR
jgi:hypothetical protein